jgi:hypothetical protein
MQQKRKGKDSGKMESTSVKEMQMGKKCTIRGKYDHIGAGEKNGFFFGGGIF